MHHSFSLENQKPVTVELILEEKIIEKEFKIPIVMQKDG